MLIGFDASRAFVPEHTGTENYSLNLLKALAKVDRKNRYRVYVRTGPVSAFSLSVNAHAWPSNFEFVEVKPSRLWTQLGLAIETWKNPVDLLFVPAHTLPLFRNPRVKTVVTIHDLGVEYLPGHHQFPQRYYLDLASKYAAWAADALIAVSRATKRDLVKRYGVSARKVFVVSEGVDRRFFRRQSKSKVQSVKSKYKIKGPYILFVGTVQPRKNLEMLIAAFASALSTSGFDCTLVIAGKLGWDYQSILRAPERFGVKDRVNFLGYAPKADLPALYSGASVFTFPSLFEGFGLPILEALACRCPVIASSIEPHKEILGNHLDIVEAGVLLKPHDIVKWSQFLYQYISQNKEIDQKNGKLRLLLQKYSWEEAASKSLGVFKKIVKRG